MLQKDKSLLKRNNSNKKAPKIAIIGCGAVAEILYLPALAKHASIMNNLTLVDPNEERVRQLSTTFNTSNFLLDYHGLLGNKVDGVIITAPSHWHHSIAMDFLSEGVPILCEKPLADNADKAKEMIAKSEETGAAILTNYHRRLHASYKKVKELLVTKTLGEPLFFHYSEGQKYSWPLVSGSRFNSKLSPRGVLLDRGAHVLDVACWWLGGTPKLLSSKNDSFGGCEAVAHIQFQHNQCNGEVQLSLLGQLPCVYKIECEQGTITGDIYDSRIVFLTKGSGKTTKIKLQSNEKCFADFGNTVVSNFLDIININEKPLVSGADVLASVAFIDECYDAATRFDMPWYDFIERTR